MDTMRIKRVTKRMSQWELAKKTGIPQSRISLIENYYVTPKKKELDLISKVLNVSVNELRATKTENN